MIQGAQKGDSAKKKQPGRADVVFAYAPDCHVWEKALGELEEAIAARRLSARVRRVVVRTKKDAERFKFTGSPTITVDGVNVDPMRRSVTRFSALSCAPYFYRGQAYEYPPLEMIVVALSEPAEPAKRKRTTKE